MKKMNWAFGLFHGKRAKWAFLFSKFVKYFVKIQEWIKEKIIVNDNSSSKRIVKMIVKNNSKRYVIIHTEKWKDLY